jgi:hypothetical protein
MRYLIIALLFALTLSSPLVVSAANKSMAMENHYAVQTADGPTTLLDGIDWDEWLESVTNPFIQWGALFGYWKMLDGIDWDEWLESLGLLPPPGPIPT